MEWKINLQKEMLKQPFTDLLRILLGLPVAFCVKFRLFTHSTQGLLVLSLLFVFQVTFLLSHRDLNSMDQVYQTALSLASGWVCQKKKKSKSSRLKGGKTEIWVCVCYSGSLLLGCSLAMTRILYQRPQLLQGGLLPWSQLSLSLSSFFPLPPGLRMVTLLAVAGPGVVHHPLLFPLNPAQTYKKLPHLNIV